MDKDATIAVTGAGGQIGSRLAAALAARGHTVRPLKRNDGDVGGPRDDAAGG
jgi:nucleoside-diphosphate-sugar epimerase